MGSVNYHDADLRHLIITEYRSGRTMNDLSRTHGVSDTTIRKWLRAAGITTRKANGRELKLDADEINRLYDSGLSSYQIAAQLGCYATSVHRLVLRPRGAHQPHREETKHKLALKSLALWRDPAYRALVGLATGTPEYRAQLAEAGRMHSAEFIARSQSAEARAATSRRVKEYWLREGYREKIAAHTARRSELSAAAFRLAMADPVKRQLWRDKLRIAAAGTQSRSGWVSSAQRQLYYILRASGIEHHEEGGDTAVGPFYVVDCIIPVQQDMAKPLIIEVQGEYWHSLPHVRVKDKQKHSYVRKHTNYDLLYLSDLNVRSMMEVTQTLEKYGLTARVDRCSVAGLTIEEIGENDADEFYAVFHYSGRARKGSRSYGAFWNGDMVAAISYSHPIRLETATRLGYPAGQVLEIARLARRTNLECKNLISYLISQTRKLLPVEVTCLVSFSDHTFQHTGGVYKAAGFVNDGQVEADYCYISMYGRYHKKTIWDRSKKFGMGEIEYAQQHGLVRLLGEPKTRWIYRLRRRDRG